ncbi:unnamed protein product [Rotaria socialis]|nr:unnamed protein product [Rotaria socialis]
MYLVITLLLITISAYLLSEDALSIFDCCSKNTDTSDGLQNNLLYNKTFNIANFSSCPDYARNSPFNALSEAHVKEAVSRKVQLRWKRFVSSVSPYPENKFSGRGIVSSTSSGLNGCRRLLASLQLLRWLNCTLPVEVYAYANELEMHEIRNLKAIQNVTLHIIKDKVILKNRKKSRFVIKPFSILQSSFEHVLWMDSDNIAVNNPEYLFDLPHYKNSTAIFWPDFWKTSGRNPIWRMMNIRCREEDYEQESGQLVINKRLAWKALNLALYLNSDNDIIKLIHGDKDTFRLAWRSINVSYFFIRTHLAIGGFDLAVAEKSGATSNERTFCGHTMVQHDPLGKVLFLHTNLVKQYPAIQGLIEKNQTIKQNKINPWRVYIGYTNTIPNMDAVVFFYNLYVCTTFTNRGNSTWSPLVEQDFYNLVPVSITEKYLSYLHGNLIKSNKFRKIRIIDRHWQKN